MTTNVPKPPISIRIPVAPLNNPPNLTPTNLNKKGFEVNFKKWLMGILDKELLL